MPDSPREVTIYTDGACSTNPGPGGYGIVMLLEGRRQELSGGFRKTTNNRMELVSVIRALQALAGPRRKVTIYSDAQYVVKMYSGGYAARWRKNGWMRNKGKDPALNSDLWGQLLDECERHDVEFVWVRGHGSNAENIRCDELAVAARLVENLPVDAGYETPAKPEAPGQMILFQGL
jgi:ribonuclease HI